MIQPSFSDVTSNRTTPAGAKSPGQLPHGQFAQRGELRECRVYMTASQALIYQPQPPTGQSRAVSSWVDSRAITLQLDGELGRH